MVSRKRVRMGLLAALLALVAVIPVLTGWPTPAWAATTTVVVANAGSNSVTLFDLTTGTSVTLTDPALVAPRYVAITTDNRHAAIGNGGGDPGLLVWLDLTTHQFIGTTDVGRNPQGIAMTKTKAVVALRGANPGVAIVDLTPLEGNPPATPSAVTRRALANTDNAEGVAVTTDWRYALVTLRGNPGRIAYVDLTIDDFVPGVTTIGADTEPFAVAVTPDGDRAVVANNGSAGGTISIIDINALPGTVVGAPIPVGSQPRGIAVTPDGASAVVALAGPNQVAIVNLSDLTTALRGVGPDPFGVAVTYAPTPNAVPGGTIVTAVANEGSSGGPTETVTLLDLHPGPSFTVTGATNASPIAVTTALAHGLATGQRVSIAGVLGNTAANGVFPVTVVDATHFTLDGSIGSGAYTSGGTGVAIVAPPSVPVGDEPRGIAITSVRPPRGILTANPRSAKVGNVIQVDGSETADLDGGTVEKYTFDFGDNTIVTKVCATDPTCATATHVYTKAGAFRPSLIATDDDGAPSRKALATTVTIKANKVPKALFAAAPVSGKVPLLVTFTNQSTDSDGLIAGACWNFGQGVAGCNSTAINPTHTFSVAGSYTVELVAIDDSGGQSTPYRRRVTVVANKAPKALFTATPLSGKSPLVVKFTNKSTDSDGTVAAFCWNFGEGTPGCNSIEASPTRTFSTVGAFKVQLVVTDDSGTPSGAYTRNITVKAP
jgi:PKD repeat protein/DNA-binding beta-propeller fold protein YncE